MTPEGGSASSSPSTGDRTRFLLARRDAILGAVARTAQTMARGEPWTDLVPEALRILGEATGVSRVYVFEIFRREAKEAGEAWVRQRFEWVAPGVEPQIGNPELQEVPLVEGGFTRWRDEFLAGRPIAGDIHEFPASERRILDPQQILSILVQPIFAGPTWWGFVGFDACASLQSWERVEIDTLHIAARVIGTTIHQQEREGHLRQARKMEALGRMAGGVAHDFNNVMMVLSGSLDLLKADLERGGAFTPGRKANVTLMEQALRQTTGLTRRLLDFSRRREGPAHVVSLPEHLRNGEGLVRQALGSAIELAIEADPAALPVRIDPVQLDQVVLNLAVNARDAMPAGGSLRCEIRTLHSDEDPALSDRLPEGTWTLLRVRDTGAGMPPEVRERIFEPFFTTKGNEGGTGLGLSTVYGVVTGAGGRVEVSSEAGRGSDFRIYLPSVVKPAAVVAS